MGLQDMLIGGGRILAIGSQFDALAAKLPVEILDLEGARVLPGLVDCHAHTTGGGGEDGAETRVPAPALSSYTRAGVTSVVGLLGTDAETRGMPELLAATRALRAGGLSAWCYTGGYHLPARTLTGSVRGDIVHLDSVVGVGELALSDFRSSQPTLAELLRIASEAQVGGMLAGKAGVVHLHMGDGERGLELIRQALEQSELPARVFHPTHINRQPQLLDEAAELAEQGCSVDITCFPDDDGDAAVHAPTALEQLLAAGVDPAQITMSSDSGGCLPSFDEQGQMTHMGVAGAFSMAQALAALFDGGLDPAQFIPAFTSNPARLLKLPGKGVLVAGGPADLVVLNQQHLPHSVMSAGVWHLREGASLQKGPFEN